MRARSSFALPLDKERDRRRATRLAWITIAAMLSVVVVLYFAMGGSQAMRTAWIEDMLSLVPPISLLVAAHFERKAPDEEFPYGRYRTVSVAFLVSSLALAGVGLFLIYESVLTLVRQERPAIGVAVVFGETVWLGWIMIAALLYAVAVPMWLGRLKLPLAERLHDKALHADAQMAKADWITGVAAIVGVIGIGIGWWWADALAALAISLSVVHDGARGLRQAVLDLMDHRPASVGGQQPLDLPERLARAVRALDWVEDADVRIREEGHLLTGEVFVVPRDDRHLTARLTRASRELLVNDWRLYDLALVPVLSLQGRAGEAGHDEPETPEETDARPRALPRTA